MNKARIDFSQVRTMVRKALRQQAINKLHLMLLGVTNIKQEYITSYREAHSVRLFMPPLFLLVWVWHMMSLLIDVVWLLLESIAPWVPLEVCKENINQIVFSSGHVKVYVVVVDSDDGLRYNSACDNDHVNDLWDGHHD